MTYEKILSTAAQVEALAARKNNDLNAMAGTIADILHDIAAQVKIMEDMLETGERRKTEAEIAQTGQFMEVMYG